MYIFIKALVEFHQEVQNSYHRRSLERSFFF